MTPHLSLQGRIGPGESGRVEVREWLARAALWFETAGDAVLAARPVLDEAGERVLRVCFHPVAPDLEIRVAPSGDVRAAAATGPAGPGYHAYLSAALDLFAADFGIRWEQADDPTGFRASGCADTLAGHFLESLRAACRGLPRVGTASLGLPADLEFTYPGPVLTPLGPRSRVWAAAVAADPDLGVGVIPWWRPELDAEFFRHRALVSLWCEFPWRAPLSEDEGELVDQIAADLDLAYALDPSAPLPWAAWAEVVAALDGDREGFSCQQVDPRMRDVIAQHSAKAGASRIGYRRYPVRLAVGGGWSVEVPGTFADGWEADGQTWVGWEDRRRVTARAGGPAAPRVPSARQCRDEIGRRVWRLEGTHAAGDSILTCRVDVLDATDRDWAVGVFRSLRHDAAGRGATSVA